jgi:hypothetical protein
MKVRGEVPEFAWPARFAYTYAAKALAWLLDGHAFLREALLRRWPGSVHRSLILTERIVEIPFALRALELPRGSRALDLGAKASPLPLFLSAQGLCVVAVDLSPFPIQGTGPDFVLAGMRSPPFRSEPFDAAAIVSTLKHVGVDFYDSKVDPEDDLGLMDRLRALVRHEGRVGPDGPLRPTRGRSTPAGLRPRPVAPRDFGMDNRTGGVCDPGRPDLASRNGAGCGAKPVGSGNPGRRDARPPPVRLIL